MDNKKSIILDKINFALCICIVLIYLIFAIIGKDPLFLVLSLFPVCFILGILCRTFYKYKSINPNIIKKISGIFAILNILFNGLNLTTVSTSLRMETTDWDNKDSFIYYPLIPPYLFFAMLLTIPIGNFLLAAIINPNLDNNEVYTALWVVTIIVSVIILIGFIISLFSTYFTYGKKYVIKNITAILVVIFIFTVASIYRILTNKNPKVDLNKIDMEYYNEYIKKTNKTTNY